MESDISTVKSTSMYPHIPDQIRREFETSQQTGVKCETTLKRGRKAVIYLVVPTGVRINTEICLKNIIAWLNFVSEFASPKCSQTLNVYLLLTNAKKLSPNVDAEPIDTVHANTAFTTFCLPLNNVYVFRREEWFKVFMHETFHCFGLDFSSSNGDVSNQRILSLFKAVDPNTDIRLYETFCEMWAEIFNVMFCIFMNKRGECTQFSNRKYFAVLQKERRFSIYQSNKILRRAGYNYKSIFMHPLNNKPKYAEKTQAFSYYVIKSLMLWNLDRFIRWCETHCERGQIQFDHKYIAAYCDLVDEFAAKDEGYMRETAKITTSHKIEIHNTKTLRMTSIDPRWCLLTNDPK